MRLPTLPVVREPWLPPCPGRTVVYEPQRNNILPLRVGSAGPEVILPPAVIKARK